MKKKFQGQKKRKKENGGIREKGHKEGMMDAITFEVSDSLKFSE